MDDMTLGELLYVALCPDPASLWVPAGPAQARALADPVGRGLRAPGKSILVIGAGPQECDWIRKRFIEGSTASSPHDDVFISVDEFGGFTDEMIAEIKACFVDGRILTVDSVSKQFEPERILPSLTKMEYRPVPDEPKGYQPPAWITKRGRR